MTSFRATVGADVSCTFLHRNDIVHFIRKSCMDIDYVTIHVIYHVFTLHELMHVIHALYQLQLLIIIIISSSMASAASLTVVTHLTSKSNFGVGYFNHHHHHLRSLSEKTLD